MAKLGTTSRPTCHHFKALDDVHAHGWGPDTGIVYCCWCASWPLPATASYRFGKGPFSGLPVQACERRLQPRGYACAAAAITTRCIVGCTYAVRRLYY